ncbi:MAG: hypothetical protein ACLPLR_04825 [Terriglobales bacterium]
MTSDPKLNFDGEPARAGELQPATETAVAAASAPSPLLAAARVWLRRIGMLVFVFLCATLGVMLMILPWRPEWSDNHLLIPYPMVRAVVASGFARGVSTGLGVLNVWIGFWEAMQYREEE